MEVWIICPPLQAAALLSLWTGLMVSSSWFCLSFLRLLIFTPPLSLFLVVRSFVVHSLQRHVSSRPGCRGDGVCLFGPPLISCQPEQPIRVISVPNKPNDSLCRRTIVWKYWGQEPEITYDAVVLTEKRRPLRSDAHGSRCVLFHCCHISKELIVCFSNRQTSGPLCVRGVFRVLC